MKDERFEALSTLAEDKSLHIVIHAGSLRGGTDSGRRISRISVHDGHRELVGVDANDKLRPATKALLEKLQALQSA